MSGVVRYSFLFLANSNDSRSSVTKEDSLDSDELMMDDDEDSKPSEDELEDGKPNEVELKDEKLMHENLEDYAKPSFWLFIELRQETPSKGDLPEMKASPKADLLEMKFYLYCGFDLSDLFL